MKTTATIIETLRWLNKECLKEEPDLSRVEYLCGATFEAILHNKTHSRPVFTCTDVESLESTKATYVAWRWAEDVCKIDCYRDSNGCPTVFKDPNSSTAFYLKSALEAFHHIQLSQDPRYIKHLKNAQQEAMDRVRDQLPDP